MKTKSWTTQIINLNENELTTAQFEQKLYELWDLLLNGLSLPQTDLVPVQIEIPIHGKSRLNKKGVNS